MELYRDRLIAYSLGNFATYYGISVAGIKGIAPILVATLDEEGRFVEGEIISTRQLRPAGPTPDPENRALNMIRGLSIEDFGNPGLTFHADGRITPAERPPVTRRTFPDDNPRRGGAIKDESSRTQRLRQAGAGSSQEVKRTEGSHDENNIAGALQANYPSVVGTDRFEVDAERPQLAVQVRAFHADALRELPDLAVAKHQLLLQVGTLELLARFAQRQGQQVLLDQRFVFGGGRRDLRFDFLQ